MTSICLLTEDNLNILVYGRRPQKITLNNLIKIKTMVLAPLRVTQSILIMNKKLNSAMIVKERYYHKTLKRTPARQQTNQVVQGSYIPILARHVPYFSLQYCQTVTKKGFSLPVWKPNRIIFQKAGWVFNRRRIRGNYNQMSVKGILLDYFLHLL